MPEQVFGSDNQLHDAEQSTARLAPAEKRDAPDDIFAASEPASAAQRLRAFEDEHLGPDTPRFAGQIERGHGSPLRNLSPELQRKHTTIERLIESENKVAEAAAKLSAADAHHEAAKTHAARAADAVGERSDSEQGRG